MSKAKIFLVGEEQHKLIPMIETSYPEEKDIQMLLEEYWDLLPGDQIDPENPRRWLLVKREMGVPGGPEESDRWSLDHLFLDQDGIPTFVECKRASDTDARRKVVAQMLDYAANGIEYLGGDKLRRAAAVTAEKGQYNLDQKVRELKAGPESVPPETLDPDPTVEDYWQAVASNLESGKVRLIFVTDEAPRELRRLVEFLNDKMADVKSFVVEIKQYLRQGETQKALVPMVVVRPSEKPGPELRKPLDRAEFLARCKPEAREFFESMLDKAEAKRHYIYWGQTGFSVRAHFSDGKLGSFAYGFLSGEFQYFSGQLPLSEEESKRLREELWNLGGFTKTAPKTLTAVVDTGNVTKLAAVYDFILDKVDSILSESSKLNPSQVEHGSV
jgi:hypothetical protein